MIGNNNFSVESFSNQERVQNTIFKFLNTDHNCRSPASTSYQSNASDA